MKFDGTRESLMHFIQYNPDTGEFIKPDAHVKHFGKKSKARYVVIDIDGKNYYAHRLAWLYVHGVWPKGRLDHRDGNKRNNRILNLRPASGSQNAMNRSIQANNTSGFRGVHQRSGERKFRAQIQVEGRKIRLGTHHTADEAAHAYNKAAIQHFGEFAVLNPVGA